MAEKQLVIDFLNRHWGSQHPLVNNKTLFDLIYENLSEKTYAEFEQIDLEGLQGKYNIKVVVNKNI